VLLGSNPQLAGLDLRPLWQELALPFPESKRIRRSEHAMVTFMVTKNVATQVRAGEFKAKCLELMDQVAATGASILITKRGEPVARLVPVERPLLPLLGCAKGLIELVEATPRAPRKRSGRKERAQLLSDALRPLAQKRPRRGR
jgi:prevent-host-death family protein